MGDPIFKKSTYIALLEFIWLALNEQNLKYMVKELKDKASITMRRSEWS